MVEIKVIYEGNLRCQMIHGPSGSVIATDAPADNHGKAELFSPTDLVGAAVGSCVLTVMGIVAQRHGIRLQGASAEVTKEMASEPHRRIGKIMVLCRMPAGIDPSKRGLLEKTAQACPVKQSLHPDVQVSIDFHYPD